MKTFEIVSKHIIVILLFCILISSCKWTRPKIILEPEVILNVDNLNNISVNAIGEVIDTGEGIIESGICWKYGAIPSTNDTCDKYPRDSLSFSATISIENYKIPLIIRAYTIANNNEIIYSKEQIINIERNTWYQYEGDPKFNARSSYSMFTVNKKIYVACGNDDQRIYDDFWEIDPGAKPMIWKSLNRFPGGPRKRATGFVIDKDIYLGTGADQNQVFTDFYKYNFDAGDWVQIPPIPGPNSARKGADSFTINGRGYVIMGCNFACGGVPQRNNVFRYSNSGNWEPLKDFPGIARGLFTSFVIRNTAYVACGTNYQTGFLTEVWKYHESLDEWERLTDFIGDERGSFPSFVIDDVAYIGAGENNGIPLSDFFSYDGDSTWTETSSLPISLGWNSGVSIDGVGYVLGGADRDGLNYKILFQYVP